MSAPRSENFSITVHRDERIIEVVYPSHPTLGSFETYDREIRAAIQALGAPWDCLVDQRAVAIVPPEVTDRIVQLNAWARKHGMNRTARVLKDSAVAELQVSRIFREGGILEGASKHRTREEGWEALRTATDAATRLSPSSEAAPRPRPRR